MRGRRLRRDPSRYGRAVRTGAAAGDAEGNRRHVRLERTRIRTFGHGYAESAADEDDAASDLFDRRDENATDRDSINIFGGARLYKNTWAINAKKSVPRNLLTISTGIDFDLDGTKKPHENTIDFGVPLAYEWVAPRGSTGFFTGHVLTLTPKFGTDRAFDREVYNLDLLWSFTSERLLRAGYLTRFPRAALRPRATIAWVPTVQVELGNVADPAGNADLDARKGTFLRVAPRIDLTFRPIAIHERLSLALRYFYRIDLREDWQRPYGEATLAYDLTPTGFVAFTVAHRRGRKPPDFKDTKTTVIGIGIKK